MWLDGNENVEGSGGTTNSSLQSLPDQGCSNYSETVLEDSTLELTDSSVHENSELGKRNTCIPKICDDYIMN